MAFCLFLPLVGHASDGGEDGAGILIDRAVALVNDRVLTLSQLDFDTRVLLVEAGGVEAAFAPLDEATLKKGLDTLIGQLLETAEADKLNAFPLEEGELQKAVDGFEQRLGGGAALGRFLEAHEADTSALAAVLGRALRTQRVVDAKVRLKAVVSEAEARRWQDAHPEARGLPLAAVRNKLFAQRYQEQVVQELKQIRKGASVRLLGPFAPSATAEAR